jgi:hypothetical protein
MFTRLTQKLPKGSPVKTVEVPVNLDNLCCILFEDPAKGDASGSIVRFVDGKEIAVAQSPDKIWQEHLKSQGV